MSEVIKLDFVEVLKKPEFSGIFENPEQKMQYNENIEIYYKENILYFKWIDQGKQKSSIEIANGGVFLDNENIKKLSFEQMSFSGNVISDLMQYHLHFVECVFNSKINVVSRGNEQQLEYSKSLKLETCTFLERVQFSKIIFIDEFICTKNIFKKNALFTDSTFQKFANFQLTKFKQTGSFVKSIFLDGVRFNSAEFRKGMFEGVVLKSFCFFQSCILDTNKFSFNGITLGKNEKKDVFNFIEEYYRGVLGERKNINDEEDALLMMRDTARKIKSTFLAQHNIIEASYWSKIELYCREVELRQKKEVTISELTDRIQLAFYRCISDHHTDLLKIISWTIFAIGLFGLSLFVFRYGTEHVNDFVTTHISNNADIPKWISNKWLALGCYSICFFSIFCKLTRNIIYGSIALSMYLFSNKYILGIGGSLLGSNGLTRTWLENLCLLIYSIAMFLLVFSLQKTARKNSIIPS